MSFILSYPGIKQLLTTGLLAWQFLNGRDDKFISRNRINEKVDKSCNKPIRKTNKSLKIIE